MREIGPRDLSPVQGDPFWLDGSQGLKPWAEPIAPSGHKTIPRRH
jgi:hypothetical protein